MAEDKAKKLLLIVNPVSGKKMAKRYMMKMINRFDEAGYSVTACCTQKNKNAYDITLSRGAGFDLIVCVGGDGTLKETVAGVMKLGKDIPLGFIPLGSTNDFAKSLGIPIDVSDAVDAIINGTPMPVDMGVFGKDSFIYVAGFGNFTAISYSTNQKVKNVLGKNAYYLQAVGGMPVLHNMGVEFNDGLFEMVLVNMFKNPGEIAYLANSMVRKNVKNNRLVTIRHCKNVKFIFDKPTPFTLDGEYGGAFTEIDASCIHNAVRIMLHRSDWVELPNDSSAVKSEDEKEPVEAK